MNSTNDTNNKSGTDADHLGGKIAAWGIVIMILWLFWNQ